MKVTICRKASFNAAHRLFRADWTDEKNLEIFGACSNPNYHGHNYELEVKIFGEIDSETGYVMDMKVLKKIIETEVENKFDHRNLNLDMDDFKLLNPTAENIAVIIYKIIKSKISPNLELSVILHETEKNYVEYSGR